MTPYIKLFAIILINFTLFSSAVSAIEPSSINAEKLSIPKTSQPKSEYLDKKNQVNIPEGGKAIKGMNIPLKLQEINIYGLDIYKKQTINILKQRIKTALKISGSKQVSNTPNIVKNPDGSYKITVNSEVNLSLVYALAQQLTTKYQNDKYFLSRAIVPAQEIDKSSGKIDLCVIEGYLSAKPKIEIKKGGKRLNKLKKSLGKRMERLVSQKPLSFTKFERELLLIRDMPEVDIQTTFQQIPERKRKGQKKTTSCKAALENGMGKTRLAVSLSVKKFSGAIGIDNYGIDSTGPNFLRLNINANSVFLAGDQYSLDAALSSDTDELKSYSFTTQVPLGSKGLKLNAAYRLGDAVPGESFKELEIENKTVTSEVGLEYPYIRSRKRNLILSGKVQHQDIDTELLGREFVQDKVRTLHAKAVYDSADKHNGINYLSLEAVAGLDTGDATQEGSTTSSRPEAKPDFIKYIAEAKRYQKLPFKVGKGSFTWINSLKLQHASEPLFASEEFELGGRGFGRGFDIGSLSGDKGAGVSTQLDYDINKTAGNVKIYGFVDYGKVWNIDDADEGTDLETADLSSAGIGVNFESKNNWYVNTEFAKPLSISGDREKKAHAYVGIGRKF